MRNPPDFNVPYMVGCTYQGCETMGFKTLKTKQCHFEEARATEKSCRFVMPDTDPASRNMLSVCRFLTVSDTFMRYHTVRRTG